MTKSSGGNRPQDAVDQHRVAQAPGLQHHGRGDLPDDDAQQRGHAAQADDGGALFQPEPVGRHLGARIQEQRLGDGDADGHDQRQGVVLREDAAQQPEDRHHDGAQADGLLEAPGVDQPGGRQRQRDVDVHEHQRQQADGVVRDAQGRAGRLVDGRIADPEDLHHQADEGIHRQHHPAVPVDLDRFFSFFRCHRSSPVEESCAEERNGR